MSDNMTELSVDKIVKTHIVDNVIKENIIKEVEPKNKSGRRNISRNEVTKRVPIYKQKGYDYSNLNLDTDTFAYRWANGYPMNMERYKKGGWEQVFGKNGKPITRRGKNDDVDQYLHKIPKEFYKEDQLAKLAEPLEIERRIKMGRADINPKSTPQGIDSKHYYGNNETVVQLGKK
jgi:hypothetical protein